MQFFGSTILFLDSVELKTVIRHGSCDIGEQTKLEKKCDISAVNLANIPEQLNSKGFSPGKQAWIQGGVKGVITPPEFSKNKIEKSPEERF